MRRLIVLSGALFISSCSERAYSSAAHVCSPAVSAAPASVSMKVGDSISIVYTVETDCAAPRVQNETPAILQVDSLGVGSIRVTALANGQGRVRIRSRVDTLVSMVIPISVGAAPVATPSANDD